MIVAALRDIFQELFRPSGGGVLSRSLMSLVWRTYRHIARLRPSALEMAGPSILIAVIAGWTTLLIGGWALIYWPRLPGKFLLSTGLDPSANGGFIDALYVSAVTLTTLGYGDITPTIGWLRILAPMQALVGFGLLTAAISWVLSIYPVLSRRRSLAREITLRQESAKRLVPVEETDPRSLTRTLEELASRLVSIEGDLVQFPVTYYFHNGEEPNSLPVALPYLLRLSARLAGEREMLPETRLRALMLHGAIEELAARIGTTFLNLEGVSTEEILTAYARDHLQAGRGNEG